ncbi:hypothetical protein Tco_0059347 [Tanacetum coccineum]
MGCRGNLIPPSGIEGSRGRVIRENLNQKSSTTMRGTPEGEEIFKKMKMTIEAGNDVDQARKIIRDNLDGLGQDMDGYQSYVEEYDVRFKARDNAAGMLTWGATSGQQKQVTENDLKWTF